LALAGGFADAGFWGFEVTGFWAFDVIWVF